MFLAKKTVACGHRRISGGHSRYLKINSRYFSGGEKRRQEIRLRPQAKKTGDNQAFSETRT